MQYGFLIILAAFIHHVIYSGIVFSFNILHVYIVEEYKTTATMSGLTGTIGLSVYHLASLLSSTVFTRIGHRRAVIVGVLLSCTGLFMSAFVTTIQLLWVSFGVFTAGGGSLVTLTCMNMAVVYYPGSFCKRVICLVLCGTSTGVMVLPLIIETLLLSLGWKASILVLASSFLFVGVALAFIYRLPEDTSTKDNQEQHDNKEQMEKLNEDMTPTESSLSSTSPSSLKIQLWIYVKMFSRVECWLLSIGFFITAVTITFTFVNMGSLMKSNAIGESKITYILTLMGVADLVTRVLLSAAVSHLPISTTLAFSLTSILATIPTYLLTVFGSYTGMFTLSMLISVARTILYSLVLTVCVEVFGVRFAGQSIGIAYAVIGVGSLSSTFVSDVMYVKTGSYQESLYLCVGHTVSS
ncbi:uncharacterized protein LOC117122279 [Anneissia japonica]|uniref:uncharacterized protein LOC117122279 n=1 Tax=Anneissia japonica TaxID=1529436 RepID=UPI001425A16A|nr:uncharacterized protein LOC117122279 [Anneissia japonica]